MQHEPRRRHNGSPRIDLFLLKNAMWLLRGAEEDLKHRRRIKDGAGIIGMAAKRIDQAMFARRW
jgi:hypothetical protein